MKKISSILLIITILFATILPTTASAYKVSGFEIKSEVAVLMSLDTDDVLYAKNGDEKRYPASLTKIMTAVIAFENIDDLDKKVTVKQELLDSLLGTELTLGGLVAGEKISYRVMLNLLMVCSAADAAVVLSDNIGGGDRQKFIDMMNDKAAELGMKKTNYTNETGVHDDNHYTTANDLTKLCKYIYKIPLLMEMCSQYYYTAPADNKHSSWTVAATNMLLNPTTVYYYKYAKGIKTGFTTPAGRCVASTATKDGYNYLCIVMGGDDATRTEFSDSKNLYEWAFENFEYRTIASTDEMISEMEVDLNWDVDHVQLFPAKNVSVIVPKDLDNSSIITDVVLKDSIANAPIEENQVMGYARITCAGEEVAQVKLVSHDKIERSTMLYLWKIVKTILSSGWFIALFSVLILLLAGLIVVNIFYNKRRRKHMKKVKKFRKL